jgi:Ca2+-binding EF-hand superfamily protein
MAQFCSSLTIAVLLAGTALAADDKRKPNDAAAKPANVTITKVEPKNGTITVRMTDDKGQTREKTFQLTSDIRLLDETGRAVKIDVFESGNDALVVESEGKLKELRRMPHAGGTRRLSDSVRTLIEMADVEQGCAEDLQQIYDMLRKLDTGRNGKIDPTALKAEADHILRDRVKAAFDRLDTNKDGKISREEARGLIKEHFDQIDTNKDGFITFDELLNAAKTRHQAKAAAQEKKDGKSTSPTTPQKEKN